MVDYEDLHLPNHMIQRTWTDGSGKVAYLHSSVASGEVFHCNDGPAIIDPMSPLEEWYFLGMRHRENGPALVTKDYSAWFNFGKLHRLNGPALVSTASGDNRILWAIAGNQYQFTDWLTIVSGILPEDQVIEIILKYT